MDETQNEAFVEWLEKVFAHLEAETGFVENPGSGVFYLHASRPLVRMEPGVDCLAQIDFESRVP